MAVLVVVLTLLLALFVVTAGGAEPTSLDPRDFGGRFDVPDWARQNDEAIARMAAAATNDGPNVWDFSGGRWFYVTQPVRNPMRAGFGSADNKPTLRPLNWSITGRGVGGIRSLGIGYALELRDAYAINYPPENLAMITVRDLKLSGDDGGLYLYGGGKTFAIENVQIVNCESRQGLPALKAEALDGMSFGRIYVQHAAGDGVHLDQCHHVDFDMLTVRNVKGDALVARDFASFTGTLYCENNHGWGLNLERGTSSNLQVWCELNRKGLDPQRMTGLGAVQNRRRNVTGCVFAGKTGAEASLAWDDDDVSAALNDDLSDPARWPLSDRQLGTLADGVGTPVLRGPWNGKAKVSGSSVVFEPGAFNAPGAGRYIELDIAEVDLWVSEGELFVFDLEIFLDRETSREISADLERGRQGPAIGMRMIPSDNWERVEPGSLAQYPRVEGDNELRTFWRCKKAGRGILRPMIYAGLGNPPQDGSQWPARELRYSFANVMVSKLERPQLIRMPTRLPHFEELPAPDPLDLNGDGMVNALDVGRWGELLKAGDLAGDLNRDGRVTITDLGVLSEAIR